MQKQTKNTQEQQKNAVQCVQQESSNGGTATITDNRPSGVAQRKLSAGMQNNSTQPLQRKKPSGSTKFQKIAYQMGQQYGVDTSRLKATHNSSFPAKLNAEATIQGNKVHFAPGMDTNYNIRHEVAHAIDNAINGTPKGNTLIKGQRVDTTRENIVDKMASNKAPIQRQKKDNILKNTNNEPTIIQRVAEIKRDMLNVIGENHDDSNGYDKELLKRGIKERRRDYEKKYAVSFFGQGTNCYWEEQERITEVSRQYGDNLELRVVQNIGLLIDEYLGTVSTFITAASVADKAKYLVDKKFMFLMLNMSIEIDRLKKEVDNGYELKYCDEEWVEQIDECFSDEEFTKSLGKLADDAFDVKKDVEKMMKVSKEHLDLDKTLKEFIDRIININKQKYNKRGAHKRFYHYRSDEMHIAAKIAAKSNKIGIWKVGDIHANDMKKIKYRLSKRPYNLIVKDEFDQLYTDWRIRKDALNDALPPVIPRRNNLLT